MSHFKLSNGVLVPQIGFGTFRAEEGKQTCDAVKHALEVGYRQIDTANVYGNEKSVGLAINQSKVKRKDIFVTTKLWNSDRGYEKTLKAFDTSLNKLGLDYIDLYLLHWPASAHQFSEWEQINADSYRALEKIYEMGKVRAIGVSNFYKHHLESLMQSAVVAPMVNQIEVHPGFDQQEIIDFCQAKGILIQGWGALGSGKILENQQLKVLALKYNASVAQICISWAIAKGISPLVKSVNAHRIEQNFKAGELILEPQDIVFIDNLPFIDSSGLHPDKVEF